MTEPVHPVQMARIVHEAPQTILRVQTENGALLNFAINRDQLFNINADSANILAGRRHEA